MTVEELQSIGLPLADYNELDVLYVESALDWILQNTTLEFDKNDLEALNSLPSGVKLFIVKYREIMSYSAGTTSESVDGISQSFSDTIKGVKLREYANELMGEYMSQLRFTAARKRWNDTSWC